MKNKQNRKVRRAALRAMLRQAPVCPVSFKTYWGTYDTPAYPVSCGDTITHNVNLGVFSAPDQAAKYAAKNGYDLELD